MADIARQIRTVPAAALLVVSCGGGDASGCIEVREQLDPASSVHVIDLESVSHQTEPPTSGPHVAAPPPAGVVDSPIPTAVQVSILEAGRALVQWEEGSDASVVAELEGLAGPTVVVAPGSGLPAPIVVTAWTWKLTCRDLDLIAISDFAANRPADAPGHDQ